MRHPRTESGATLRGKATRIAFTLLELLVTLAIITVLLSLLLPSISSTMAAARTNNCMLNQRKIAFDFAIFADDQLHGRRGDDDRFLPPGQFYLHTFVESEYEIDEFWDQGPGVVSSVPLPMKHILRCPEVRVQLKLANLPCYSDGLTPAQGISYAFNHRLWWRVQNNGPAQSIRLRSSVLSQASVPLLWDTDGEVAVQEGNQTVTFSMPGIDAQGRVYDGPLFAPARRHNGTMNVAFIDGSVANTRNPLAESSWRWHYQFK